MSSVILSPEEEEALYGKLKPIEGELVQPLGELLRRIERALFSRLTIEELEALTRRTAP